MRRLPPVLPSFSPIQRMEKQVPKVYYAPEWRLDESGIYTRDGRESYSPMHNYNVTPDKWEYLNKVHNLLFGLRKIH